MEVTMNVTAIVLDEVRRREGTGTGEGGQGRRGGGEGGGMDRGTEGGREGGRELAGGSLLGSDGDRNG